MPHVMKTIYKLLVLAVVAMGVCSCDMESQSTPGMAYSKSDVHVTHLDGSRDTITFGDTLLVGDTARMEMSFYGITHSLTIAQVTYEPDGVACSFECDSVMFKDVLEPDTRLHEGYLHFQPNTMTVRVIYCYVAKSAGTHPMNFVVESMAKEPYSHIELPLNQAVR